jgi:hypothetical protein
MRWAGMRAMHVLERIHAGNQRGAEEENRSKP